MSNRSFFIATVILIVSAFIAFSSYLPSRFDSVVQVKVSGFPMVIGEWSATEIPLSERSYQILETRNLFLREYKNKRGDVIYLYVIYSEYNRKVSHPHEVCYMGSGVTIVYKSSLQISDSIRAMRMLIEKGDSRQLVVYWYKAGYLNTDKYLRQQIKIVTERMLGRKVPSALIRIATDIKKNEEEEDALSRIKSFCLLITPLLSQYIP